MNQRKIFKSRPWHLLIFELKFRILAVLLIFPISTLIADIMAETMGYNYISFDIIQSNFFDIRVWLFFIVNGIFFAVCSLIEIYMSLVVFFKKDDETYSLKDICISGFKELKRACLLKNIVIFPITIFLVLFSFSNLL